MRNIFATAFCLLVIFTTAAFADTIANRFGLTARVGGAIPGKLDDAEFINSTTETEDGVAWNGGFIYGFNDNIAGELEISYLPELDVEINGIKAYEAKIADYAIGLQYRFMPKTQLVPYVGAGFDFINGDLKHVNGNKYDLDWTWGGHVGAGLDWFLTKGIALTADLRGTAAVSGDIERGNTKVNEYDPFWVQGTVGVRLILPEKW